MDFLVHVIRNNRRTYGPERKKDHRRTQFLRVPYVIFNFDRTMTRNILHIDSDSIHLPTHVINFLTGIEARRFEYSFSNLPT